MCMFGVEFQDQDGNIRYWEIAAANMDEAERIFRSQAPWGFLIHIGETVS
ncbi:hypothetical protein [Caulobacter phage Cr30]|nr:hypothetical protein OZ74_gp186 [Caulobacter phage Cr30]AGS81157.1 hypothetical protein [Caulobacter phage Cr30]